MKSKRTNNPFAELDKIFNLTDEPQGAEWFTPKKYAEHAGLGYSWAASNLKKQVQTKVLECWTGVSKSTHKRIIKYRLIENKRNPTKS